jgi:hypothetical protein
MSKRINVNPDHYKVAGRERPGDAVVKRPLKRSADLDKSRERWQKARERARAAAVPRKPTNRSRTR